VVVNVSHCTHKGPFVAARCGTNGSADGSVAVFCAGCGAFQYPYPWKIEPHERPVPWYGEEIDHRSWWPDGATLTRLSDTSHDWRTVHLVAFEVAKSVAFERKDAGWFIRHGLIPPFWETKIDEETGDILVRKNRPTRT
jgi:hypothetical protein